jgi:hypothetical protein
MLLRASSNATDGEVDLASAVGQGSAVGVDHGDLLLRYAEIANHEPFEAPALTDEMLAAVGPAGLVEAAATIAVFNGLVRSADAIGIPLDDVVMRSTVDHRSALGINGYAGASQSKAVEM